MLTRALVRDTEEGGKVSASKALADRVIAEVCARLEPRLAAIERKLDRRRQRQDGDE